jgi:hypothetical protein
MRDNRKTTGLIARGGTIIMTTVLSFVLSPPLITRDENVGVNWKNFFTFFAGILSILLYDSFKNKVNVKPIAYGFIGTLFLLLIGYQTLYNKYSMNCYDQLRIIVPNAPVQDSVKKNWAYWQTTQEPLVNLTQAYDCSTIKIWNYSDIIIPYYAIICVYFGIIIITTLLIILLTDQLNRKPNT